MPQGELLRSYNHGALLVSPKVAGLVYKGHLTLCVKLPGGAKTEEYGRMDFGDI